MDEPQRNVYVASGERRIPDGSKVWVNPHLADIVMALPIGRKIDYGKDGSASNEYRR